MRPLSWLVSMVLASGTVASLAACNDQEAGQTSAATTASIVGANAVTSPVPTATWPDDACGWIAEADVEALVGPLVGEPVIVGSFDTPQPFPNGRACLYRLATASAAQANLRRAFAEWRGANMPGAAETEDTSFGDSAVIIMVKLQGDVLDERASGAAWQHVATAGGLDTAAQAQDNPGESLPAADGWDYAGASFVSLASPIFIGRAGHVRVEVLSPAEIGEETRAAIASRVRDNIIDLPFGVPEDSVMRDLQLNFGVWSDVQRAARVSEPNPCELLTLAEAEAVIGPLIVPPYRAAENSPFVDDVGRSCAYYTAGHHVVLVTPEWSGGKSTFDAETAIGGLIGSVLPDDERENADLLEGDWDGPWDDATANGMTGETFFLKGDRLLRISHGLSRLDATATLPLAHAAMKRL
jgi:hypothetical protein